MSLPLTQNVRWNHGLLEPTLLNRYSGEMLKQASYLLHSNSSPRSSSATVPVGYGDLIYDILNIGNVIALQVLPAPVNTTSTANVTTTSGAIPPVG